MAERQVTLPNEPDQAVDRLQTLSAERPVLVFKKSPICPVSFAAEEAFDSYLGELRDDDPLAVARIDVIEERPLARGLTSELGIKHESPQALYFDQGKLVWHGSHADLNLKRFRKLRK